MKKISAVLALLLALCILAGCGNTTHTTAGTGESTVPAAQQMEQTENAGTGTSTAPAPQQTEGAPSENLEENQTYYADIAIANYGTITVKLAPEAAPITVANFVKLAQSGFYDGLTFHRIMAGFMMQGGDPLGNGYGGSDEEIRGEFASNGWNNPLAHERGVLSMARSNAPDSASSQFFIMHQAAPHLDGSYAAFGRVLTGMEVVDAICANTPVTDGNGSVAKANQPIITSIRVIENADK